jgi:hypothetical protein
MPAHKKSLKDLELNGSTKHNPGRYAGRKEPVPAKPLGNAPKHLSKDERKVWNEIAANCLPETLGNSDRYVFELATKLVCRFRKGELSRASEMALLLNTLGRLGLTPQDRLRLNISNSTGTETSNEWEDFLTKELPTDSDKIC